MKAGILLGTTMACVLAALCVWRGEIPEVDAALHLQDAMTAQEAWRSADFPVLLRLATGLVPNPTLPAVWQGLWMCLLGSETWVGVLALWPWWVALAVGLQWGGQALGGRWGAGLSLTLGLTAPALWVSGHRMMLDVPLAGATALLAGSLLAGRDLPAGLGLLLAIPTKLGAGPGLLPMVADGIWNRRDQPKKLLWFLGPPLIGVLLLFPWHLAELLSYSAGNGHISPQFVGPAATGARLAQHLRFLPPLLGPLFLGSTVGALLGPAGRPVLRLLGWMSAYILGISLLTHTPQSRYLLPLLPLVSIASAAMLAPGTGRRSASGAAFLALLAILRLLVAFQPAEVGSLSLSPVGELQQLDTLLDKLELQRGIAPRLRVSAAVRDGVISVTALQVRARQRGLPLDFLDATEKIPADFQLEVSRNPKGGLWQLPVGDCVVVGAP